MLAVVRNLMLDRTVQREYKARMMMTAKLVVRLRITEVAP